MHETLGKAQLRGESKATVMEVPTQQIHTYAYDTCKNIPVQLDSVWWPRRPHHGTATPTWCASNDVPERLLLLLILHLILVRKTKNSYGACHMENTWSLPLWLIWILQGNKLKWCCLCNRCSSSMHKVEGIYIFRGCGSRIVDQIWFDVVLSRHGFNKMASWRLLGLLFRKIPAFPKNAVEKFFGYFHVGKCAEVIRFHCSFRAHAAQASRDITPRTSTFLFVNGSTKSARGRRTCSMLQLYSGTVLVQWRYVRRVYLAVICVSTFIALSTK